MIESPIESEPDHIVGNGFLEELDSEEGQIPVDEEKLEEEKSDIEIVDEKLLHPDEEKAGSSKLLDIQDTFSDSCGGSPQSSRSSDYNLRVRTDLSKACQTPQDSQGGTELFSTGKDIYLSSPPCSPQPPDVTPSVEVSTYLILHHNSTKPLKNSYSLSDAMQFITIFPNS